MSDDPGVKRSRRRFVALGSATTLAALAGDALGVKIAGSLTDALSGSGYQQLSAGYSPDNVEVLAASSLPAGDATFLDAGVMLTLHGLVEASAPRIGPRLRALSAQLPFDLPDGARTSRIDHLAWHYQTSPVRNVSHPVRLSVPVERSRALHLHLQLDYFERGFVRQKSEFAELGLSVAAERGRSKLRRGTYFVALGAFSKASEHEWHRWRLASGADGAHLVSPGAAGVLRPPFDYLVFSVDYATDMT